MAEKKGGRDTGGNSSVVATPDQPGQTAVYAAGGGGTGIAVSATSTGGVAVAAFSSTGIAVSATGGGTAAAIVGTNASGGEAVKVVGDTASTTAVLAPFFVSPIQNAPSGTHAIGHMYVSAAGKLMICVSAGTPGTFTVVGLQS